MISLLLLLVKKLYHQTYYFFREQKHPQNFIFQKHKCTSPFTYHSHYSSNHLYTIGTISNYDPAKQYYFLPTNHEPTRPLFVPQEALNVNGDFLLPTHVPTKVTNFFPKMNKLVENSFNDQMVTIALSLSLFSLSLGPTRS